MISRRQLLIALGAGSFTTPLASFAQQQGKVWRVGFLSLRARPDSFDSDFFGAFLQGMRELGYVEGKNLAMEWRFTEGKNERLPGLVAELIRLNVDVIVTAGPPATRAAQKATTTLPIVTASADDMVASGFVKSLAHPGGNITGVWNLGSDLGSKRLEILLDIAPKLSRVGVLVNPAVPANQKALEIVQSAGKKRGVKILPVDTRTPQDIDNAFPLMRQQNAGALIVLLNPLFQQQRNQIAELAAKHRLPSIAGDRIYAEAGCLLSYGSSFTDGFRRVALYVDKIFKGAKPADLPVEQPTTFELVVNMKTAKLLGIKIPNSILVQATKVIE